MFARVVEFFPKLEKKEELVKAIRNVVIVTTTLIEAVLLRPRYASSGDIRQTMTGSDRDEARPISG